MPPTRANPPRMQNGTSAPSVAAIAGSAPSAVSTAAASADPPPRPAPDGMPLCSSISTVAPHASAARHARFDASAGTPSANGPVIVNDVRVAGSRTSESCGSSIETIVASSSW